MRKTAIIPLAVSMTDQDIICRLWPLGDKLLSACHYTKPGDAGIVTLHYDDDNGRITDDYILNLILG